MSTCFGTAALLHRPASDQKVTHTMNRPALLEAVAAAALAWNRSRLARIAIAKRVPEWPHPLHAQASQLLALARKDEATAKARLRKACAAAADPASLTLDVEVSEVVEPITLLA